MLKAETAPVLAHCVGRVSKRFSAPSISKTFSSVSEIPSAILFAGWVASQGSTLTNRGLLALIHFENGHHVSAIPEP